MQSQGSSHNTIINPCLFVAESAGQGSLSSQTLLNNTKLKKLNIMATAELVTAAMKKYPCIKKVFVHKITVVTNDINGRNMYRLPILLENGGKGYRHAFYYYVEAINM